MDQINRTAVRSEGGAEATLPAPPAALQSPAPRPLLLASAASDLWCGQLLRAWQPDGGTLAVVRAVNLVEVLGALCSPLAPTAVLVEAGLPGLAGAAELRQLVALRPELPILVVVSPGRGDDAHRLLWAEAGDLVSRSGPPDTAAPPRPGHTGTALADSRSGRRAAAGPSQDSEAGRVPIVLSKPEHQIAWELLQGRSNKLIARQLQRREATIKAHLRSLYRKLGVRNRTEAAQRLRALDLVAPPAAARRAGERGDHPSAPPCESSRATAPLCRPHAAERSA